MLKLKTPSASLLYTPTLGGSVGKVSVDRVSCTPGLTHSLHSQGDLVLLRKLKIGYSFITLSSRNKYSIPYSSNTELGADGTCL